MSVPPADDRTGKAQQGNVAEIGLLEPDQDLAKPVQPGVAGLHYPPTGSASGNTPLLFPFFSSGLDMWGVAATNYNSEGWFSCVAPISTQVLRRIGRCLGTVYHDTIQDWLQLCDIMPMCSGNDERQRDAIGVYQHVTLGTFFSPGPSGSAPRTPAPAVPSPSHRRCSATSTQSPPSHHTRPTLHATASRRTLHEPTVGSAHAPHSGSRTAPSARPSTGIPFAARK